MKITFLIILFLVPVLGTALPIILSHPTSPALQAKVGSLITNPCASIALRTLVKRSPKTGLIVGLLIVGIFVIVVIGSILFCNL
jgi:hypothetical protein